MASTPQPILPLLFPVPPICNTSRSGLEGAKYMFGEVAGTQVGISANGERGGRAADVKVVTG